MYRFAVQQPKKNSMPVWQEGMRISHSHFLSRDEQHAAAVLEIMCATPKPPRIPKPAPPPVPRWPLPPPPSDQVTLIRYSRHRRTSLLPLAPAPKRPCPTPQYGSLLQQRASQSAPPAIWVIAPCVSPPAATPHFAEAFEFPTLRAVCTERLLLIRHSSQWLQNGSPRPSMVQSRSQRQRHHHHHHHRAPQRRRTPPQS